MCYSIIYYYIYVNYRTHTILYYTITVQPIQVTPSLPSLLPS